MSLWGDERPEPHEHATSLERQECIARGDHYQSTFEVFSPDPE